MSRKHAEFVVLAGPQKGQVIAVVGERVVVGRSSECTIALKEDYVSRRQVELSRTADGWLMDNLSSNGTLVNGKRYKAGAKILLDTGDVLGVGMETELLFVNQGADAEDALRAWREKASTARPVTAAMDEPAAPPASAETRPADSPPPDVDREPARPSRQRDALASASDMSTADLAAVEAKKAKYKKYAIAASIYFTVMLGVIVAAFIFRDTSDDPTGPARPANLKAAEIEDALRARPAVALNETLAEEELKKARGAYDNATGSDARSGRKYRCIKFYKTYQAYRGTTMFEDLQDEQKFNTMLEGLVSDVQREYSKAMSLCANGYWPEAMEVLKKLLDMVPEGDERDPTYQGLMSNVNKWHDLAKSQAPKKRSGYR